MGLAQGGQILVSAAVEAPVRDDLGDLVSLLPLGDHELRGLTRPETVWQVVAEGLAVEFGRRL